MKEQMPSPEELKAIQEKHMTEEEIKMSEEREATFKAGFKQEKVSVRERERMYNNDVVKKINHLHEVVNRNEREEFQIDIKRELKGESAFYELSWIQAIAKKIIEDVEKIKDKITDEEDKK